MKTVKFIDKAGSKRTGIYVKCQNCQQEFITRKSQPKSCCSTSCKHEYRHKQNTTLVKCHLCKKEVRKKNFLIKTSKNGIFFCSRACKDKGQKLKHNITEIWPDHYGNRKNYDYRSLFDESELVCQRCGYDEFSSSVQIHHIDEDRSNNNKENLIPLCANCHQSLHHKKWDFEEIH